MDKGQQPNKKFNVASPPTTPTVVRGKRWEETTTPPPINDSLNGEIQKQLKKIHERLDTRVTRARVTELDRVVDDLQR